MRHKIFVHIRPVDYSTSGLKTFQLYCPTFNHSSRYGGTTMTYCIEELFRYIKVNEVNLTA